MLSSDAVSVGTTALQVIDIANRGAKLQKNGRVAYKLYPGDMPLIKYAIKQLLQEVDRLEIVNKT